jgi:predicted glycogen debranching enzyme
VTLRIEPEICRDLESAICREWLVTDGLGGYASGTVAGINTRRYHGLLVAAMNPPVQRMVLLAALEEWLVVPGELPQPLSAQEYWDGTIYPDGFRSLEEVELEGMLPVFHWLVNGRQIVKRVWMEHDVNRTVITYGLIAGPPITLQLRPLFAHRDFHAQRHGQGVFDLAEAVDGWTVDAENVRSYFQVRPAPVVRSRPDWYWRILHRAERERGLDDEEDLFTPGVVEIALEEGHEVAVSAGTEPMPPGWDAAASGSSAMRRQATPGGKDGSLANQLLLAAEQFRVARRPIGTSAGGAQRTVIAGYHWFSDWGRDTMISLPGLTLRAGTLWEARAILETTMSYLDQGLIPNRFSDSGDPPQYDTMDATLWLFQALAAYLRASGDWRFIAERLDAIEGIIDWHVRGTRHNIRTDPRDALLAGGEAGYALTWMDARIGDWVVTPRAGKPIEINALWYNALRLTADWCDRARRASTRYRELAIQARESAIARFWDDATGSCYDLVDGPDGDDVSERPNQLMALALTYPLFEGDRARRALDRLTAKLLTPYGLRTLSPDDARYQPQYRGDQRQRDAAYHMGLVWPWLLGPYLDAHLRIHGDSEAVRRLTEPFRAHLTEAGLGSISEIFEAEPPFRPVGCIAQAWSVAEVLRHALEP